MWDVEGYMWEVEDYMWEVEDYRLEDSQELEQVEQDLLFEVAADKLGELEVQVEAEAEAEAVVEAKAKVEIGIIEGEVAVDSAQALVFQIFHIHFLNCIYV